MEERLRTMRMVRRLFMVLMVFMLPSDCWWGKVKAVTRRTRIVMVTVYSTNAVHCTVNMKNRVENI